MYSQSQLYVLFKTYKDRSIDWYFDIHFFVCASVTCHKFWCLMIFFYYYIFPFFYIIFFFTFSFWMWLETIMWLSLWERQDQGRQLSWRRSVCGCGNTEWESSMKYWKFYTATISSLLLWLNKYSWASNFVHLVKCKFVDIPIMILFIKLLSHLLLKWFWAWMQIWNPWQGPMNDVEMDKSCLYQKPQT